LTDPPYNLPIDGHVSGLGRIRHREFAMGVGEMTEEAFTAFLIETLGAAAKTCRDGAIAFVCIDWRHLGELHAAGKAVFSELKNVCVWNKKNGGIGSFYRSKHEFVFVFKVGSAPHTNSFGLGETGRRRTNVWDLFVTDDQVLVGANCAKAAGRPRPIKLGAMSAVLHSSVS
jgi:hypothetical protein